MKKIKVITIIALLIILLIQIMPTICMAEDLIIDTDKYKIDGVYGYTESAEKAKGVITVLRTVGIVVGVAGIIILGIKYMLGSVQEKADYKKSLIPYIIGFAMLLTIITIVSVIYDLSNTFNTLD